MNRTAAPNLQLSSGHAPGLGGDPVAGVVKRLKVVYSYDGSEKKTVERKEHEYLVLPALWQDAHAEREAWLTKEELENTQGLLKIAQAKLDSEVERLRSLNLSDPRVLRDEASKMAGDLCALLIDMGGRIRTNEPQILEATTSLVPDYEATTEDDPYLPIGASSAFANRKLQDR